MSAHACPLCAAQAPEVGQQRLLARHDVRYFLCPRCELLFTETPYWLEAAYERAISRLDTGAVARNHASAQLTLLVAVIAGLPREATGLDFGGGHGVFVRMMRDLGLDFRWYDKHAANQYALGFESEPSRPHALVTAFEVLEHLVDVRRELDLVFAARPALVLVGTVLHDGFQPGWWYHLVESGQHVAFYSRRTMAHIAEVYGYRAVIGTDHTLFVRSDHRLGLGRATLLERVIRNAAASALLSALVPRQLAQRLAGYRSRVDSDHEALKRRP